MSHRQKAKQSWLEKRTGLGNEEVIFPSAKDPSSLPGIESASRKDSQSFLCVSTHCLIQPASVGWTHQFLSWTEGDPKHPKTQHPPLGWEGRHLHPAQERFLNGDQVHGCATVPNVG